ncbi:MAG: ABC transporter permease [Candidatus Eremiobacteraeota bacterium]|nr:ABC transporter permease [Candidatus Eremiobacteraeota bacterium]MBV8366385.1 ABC transporter permease [Candidatus Eremiobacteraeota bacterium]
MVPLGRKTLFKDVPRFLVAQAGVAFAVGLIAIEAGIYLGFIKSTILPIQESRADVWVSARGMPYFELTVPLRYDAVARARTVTGVQRAEALFLKTSAWRGAGHKLEYIRVIGFDPNGELWSPGNVSSDELARLNAPDSALVDDSKLGNLGIDGVGGSGSIGNHDVRVVGLTHGAQPVVSATFIFASLRNAKSYLEPAVGTGTASDISAAKSVLDPDELARYLNALDIEHYLIEQGIVPAPKPTPAPKPAAVRPEDAGTLDPGDDISYIMVQAQPHTDLDALKGRLTSELRGTAAYTKTEMENRTSNYWIKRTNIGFILGLIAIVGLVVGVTVAGQILYTSVVEHIREYGTLRAIGAPDSLFYAVVAEQATIMALLGFIPGIILSAIIANWAFATRGVIILITPGSAGLTLVIITAMCIASGVFAVQRALRVDPALVFRA